MTILFKSCAAVGLLMAALYISLLVASESGEVVVLTTTDGDDRMSTTRLWVVDHDGNAWLRGGSGSAWLQRLSVNPTVRLKRDGAEVAALAEITPQMTAVINRLMNEKYGWADDYIDLLFDRDDAIAVRVRPLP